MAAAEYVNKAKFYEAIVAFKKICDEKKALGKNTPQIPRYIAECFMLIADNVSNMPCYNRYTYKDLMVGDAIENCVRYFHNFDPARPEKNPFGYFSQYCCYAFNRRIFLEQREQYKKYKIIQQAGKMDDAQIDDMERNGEDGIQQNLMYDNIDDFIEKFEAKLKKGRSKNKKVRGVEAFTKDKDA